jgi:PAS domain S-box-containing protein
MTTDMHAEDPSRGFDLRWIYWIAAALAVAGIAASVLFHRIADDAEHQRAVRSFQDVAEHQVHAVSRTVETQRVALGSLCSYMQTDDDVDQERFAAFTTGLVADIPGVHALEWVPMVTAAERDAFEKRARTDAFPDFRITEISPVGDLVNARSRDIHYPVTLVYPVSSNRRALGFDLGSEPSRLAALNRAAETGRPVATAPVTLIQEQGDQRGYLMFMPVWSDPRGMRAAGELRGFVLGVFRAGDVMTGALEAMNDASLPMTVRDLDADTDLYTTGAGQADGLTGNHFLDVGGRRWLVTIGSRRAADVGRGLAPLAILVGGLVLTAVLCILLIAVARNQARTESLVESRTRDLRTSEERLRTVADLSSDFVFWRRPDGRFEYVSPAARAITGYQTAEFMARPSLLDEIILPADREPWRRHWQSTLGGERCESLEFRLRTRGGDTKWVRHRCRPIHDQRGGLIGVRASIVDITEAKRHEEELARERRLFTGGPVVVFRWRAAPGWPVEYASPNVADLLGVSADDLTSGRAAYGQCIHPEDADRVAREVATYTESGAAHFEQDYRVIDTDGRVRDVLDVTVVVRDDHGQATHYEGYLLDVSEREEARRALEESRQRLDLALSGADLGLWDWNIPDGDVIFDARWMAMLGYEPDELPSRIETWTDLVHPDDLPRVMAKLQSHLDGATGQYESEHRLRHKDGSWVWVLDRGRVLERDRAGQPVRAFGTHLDITERHREKQRHDAGMALRERAAQALARCASPADLATVAKVVTADAAAQTEAGHAFMIRLNDETDDVRLLMEWHGDEDGGGDTGADAFRLAIDGQGVAWWRLVGECRGVRLVSLANATLPDGLQRFFAACGARSVALMVMRVGRGNMYVVGLASGRDLPDWPAFDLDTLKSIREAFEHAQQRVAFERENEQTKRMLVSALERAEQANRIKSNFLARMSHEIRTPMTAIVGLTDILARSSDDLDETRRQHLSRIGHNADHLVALLNDLLDISKIDAGELQISHEPVAIADILETVSATLGPRAREKRIDLSVTCAPDVPVRFISDRLRLRQILLNLAGNAVKFTDEGSVDVIVTYRQPAGDQPGDLVVVVRDTGIGIDDDQLEAIFQPFLQASGEDLSSRGGTGLGLDISRRLARALGGDITVVSQRGLGSAFTLTLPLDQVCAVGDGDTAGQASRLEADDETVRRSLAGRRVLMVDDNPANREVVGFYLGEAGVRVDTAADGAEGVKAALAAADSTDPFEVILMDMRMPVMDGYEATAKLRQAGLDTPIIAVTAHAMDGDEQACLNFGCNAYVSKPIVESALLAKVASLLPARTETMPDEATGPEPASPSEPAAPTADTAATGVLCSNLADNPRFAPLLKRYLASLPDVRNDLAAALAMNDADATREIVHRIHGTAANFGYPDITDAARRSEAAIREGKPLDAIGDLDTLIDLLTAAIAGAGATDPTLELHP